MGLSAYELGDEMSVIGPSTFFAAKSVLLGHDVMLKRLTVDPAREDVKETFLREARMMASLAHNHIQRPLDVFEDEGYLWSVHDPRNGIRNSMQETQARQRMTIPEVAHFGAQLANALAHIHSKGYVHGKVTPNTVMFDGNGEALLVNFVKCADLAAGIWPLREAVLGLSAFSAPEEFAGHKPTDRSDLYGLAATLLYWLTGSFPREGGDDSDPVDVRSLRHDLPRVLADRMQCALAADPDKRRGSVAGLASILHEVHSRTAADTPTGFDVGARLEPEGSLGQVEIREMHGTGAFGVVFRVRQPGGQTDYALKALKPEHRGDENAYERFIREARSMQPVRHPNVIRIRGVGELQGTPYCLMDFVDGPDLAAVLEAGDEMDPARVSRIAAGIARGLAAIHAEGLVHRDIKPHNILMGRGDHPVIADFGVASGTDGTRLTLTGQAVGTPAYMAPEQFLQRDSAPSMDLWALGVMTFEMLSGALPYQGETTIDTIRAIHETEPAALPDSVPAGLAVLVSHLLRKDPDLRPANATEVAEKLEALAL